MPSVFYLEENTPQLRKLAYRHFALPKSHWRLILPPGATWNPGLENVRVVRLEEVCPTLGVSTYEALPGFSKELEALVEPHGYPSDLKNVILKTLPSVLTPVLHTRILLSALGSDHAIVASQWPSLWRGRSFPNVRFVHPPVFAILLKKILSLHKSHLEFVRETLRAPKLSPSKGTSPKVGQLGGYQVTVEHVEGYFSGFEPQQIYIHVENEAFQKREHEAFLRLVNAKRWSYWIYKDRRFFRAFFYWLASLPAFFRILRHAASADGVGLFEKLRALATRKKWEFEDLLKRTQLKVLLVSYERNPMGYVLASTAQRFGCKVVNVFNGYVHENDATVMVHPFDAYFFWTPRQKEMFQRLGLPADRAFVTGHLNEKTYLHFFEQRAMPDPSRPHLVYFSQYSLGPLSFHREEISHLLKSVLEKLPHATLTIKLHPAETDGFLKTFWAGVPRCRIVQFETSALELIPTATIALGANSTTLIESLAAGCPIAVYDSSGLMSEFIEKGVALDLRASPRPAEVLVDFLNDVAQRGAASQKARALGRDTLGITDGLSMHRMSQVIHELATC